MKRFTFRLQKLLEIRQKKEDQQKIVLAKASGEYQKELRKHQTIQENEHNLREKVKEEIKQNPKSLDLGKLKWLDYYGWQSKKIEGDILREIDKKRQAMEKELALYTKFRQEKRAVEILKEKAWQAHQEATLKEEQQILDELSQTITNKNREYADKDREVKGGDKL
ncbi:MAG: hypothetical protein HPY78_02920 [Brevinematales bacterium]|nr:hypothetical protein [Brevinematales bacterium]